MKRDAIDFSAIKPEHEAIHARLMNWAKWCRESSGGTAVHPMFRQYRNAYDEPPIPGVQCDTLEAIATQKVFIQIPEKHRWALNWWYCKPFIPVLRVRQALGVTTPALYELVNDGRTMVKNRSHA